MKISLMAVSNGVDLTDMATELHRVELEAYNGVLRAFTACGGPTWDHVDTLLGLRKELNVTDAEHKELVEKTKSDKLVHMIRKWHEGNVGESKLSSDSKKPPPPVSSVSQASSKKVKTSHAPMSLFTTQFCSQFGGQKAIFSSGETDMRPTKSVSHIRHASVVSKGVTIQLKRANPISDIHDVKKNLGTIEIRATNELIHEVERIIYLGNYPSTVQVEKAKSLLREQERAIIAALDKLAELSDDDGYGHPYDEQQMNGHHLETSCAFSEQVDVVKGYYHNSLNVGGHTGGGSTFCQPARYIKTP